MHFEKGAWLFLFAIPLLSSFSFAQLNYTNSTNQTSVCGNGVCESGESSSNCCVDCPSQSGGGGAAYGSWFCADPFSKARLVTTTSYVCSNQTRAYEYVSVNSTEAQACGAGNVCSGGNCVANQTSPVCGNGVCESGESSSNCCTDCPSNAGGAGAAYGSWYCRDSSTKARLVSITTSVCDNQTKAYQYVTANSTEAQACGVNLVCSGGNCITNQTSPVCGNGVCESGESCAPDCSGDYYVVSKDGLIEDLGSKWRLYDHDTEGTGPYYSNRYMVYKVVKGGVGKVSFTMGGSDWRRLNAFVSSDGVTWGDAVLPICCYGSGSYSFDAPAYSPFYVKFELSTGSCCGTASYVTLDKALSLAAAPPATNATLPVNDFYWNIDWIDLNSATSGREDSLAVSAGQAVSGKFAYTLWNAPTCGPNRNICDCIDEIVLGLEGDPKSCFYAGIPWCYPGKNGEASFSFTAPATPGTYNLYYAAAQAYTCDVANDVYRTSSGRKLAGKVFVSGSNVSCTDSDGGRDYYTPGTTKGIYGGINGFSTDYCSEGTNSAGLPVNLVEFYCNSSQTYASDPYNCPYGCSNGACIAQPTNATLACTDSDGGGDFDYYKKGTASGPVDGVVHSGTDYCGGDVVFEYGCNPAPPYNFFTTTYKCPNGCGDGACIQKISCGNGFCEYGETASSCSQDCTLNFRIEDVSGPSSFSPGSSATFKVKAIGNDGLPARMEDGYRIRYYLYDCGAGSCPGAANYPPVREGYAGYNNPTGEWSLYLSALSSPGNYFADVSLFCYENKACNAEPDKQYTRRVYFTVGAAPAPVLELSIATEKGTYSAGEAVKISAKTSSGGGLVDAHVEGYAVGPDGVQEDLAFAKESCVQPPCPPGALCAQVLCEAPIGVQNAVFKPSRDGSYYIKATASYGNSVAESSAKFSVGAQKKLKLYAWLEKYDFNPGDRVKVLAKLTDPDGPVTGADVYADVHWAGNVRPVYRELVGLETAAAKKIGATATATVEGPGTPVVPTGYVVAGIASSVEKQVSSPEASSEGISYEEYKKLKSAEATSSQAVIPYPGKVVPSSSVRLGYEPSTGYYEGYYAIPSDARSGNYKVAVSAGFDNQNLRESTSFSVGGEDYVSFESKARQGALEGKYGDCKDYYLKAAGKVPGDQRRMLLDIEKAGICARLGNSNNVFYSDAARIVENAAGEGAEKYVLLGIASQYYELGGDYRRSRELLVSAASGLEGIRDYLGGDQSILATVILAKYYSLLGKDPEAGDYYGRAAALFAGKQGYGSEAFLANLFAAKLYAKAGELDSSRGQYLLAAEGLSSRSSGSSDSLISAFMAGDAYEKAGEPQKAREQYLRAVGAAIPEVYGSSDIFFTYSAIGRSYERLGEKDKAMEEYKAGLKRLLSKQDSESSYFAAGLSGYLGDYGQAKVLCRKLFEQSLAEESNIGKLTLMNAYCYSVLGDSVRAKKGCDLNSVSQQSDSLLLDYVLEPLPPPVSYCSQSSDAKSSTCGNGVVDAGETSENCCIDTGCAFGDTCSKTLGKCVKPVGEIPQETILEVLMRLEEARMKLDALEGKALAISRYYGGKDQQRADAWNNAAKVFGDAKSGVDAITKDLKDNRGKIDEATLEGIRQKLDALRGSLKEAVDAILGGSVPEDGLDVIKLIGYYNNNLDRVPSFVKAILGNERINAHIKLNNGTEVVIGGVSDGGRIVEVRDGGIGNATLEVFASEAAIRDIRSSKDRAKALQDALDSKSISYRSASAATEAKLSIAARAYNLVSGLL